MTEGRRPIAHQPGLDGIRGIAIALVLASHFVPAAGGAGWIGVTIFFVLSGFLITRLLLTEIAATGRVGLSAFYIRRGGRLVPELVAVVLAVTVVAMLTGERFAIGNAAVAMTYTADVVTALGIPLGPLSHTWSLAVEEQFYLLWPIALVLLMTRLSRPLLPVAGIAIAALLWRTVLASSGVALEGRYFGPDGQLDALMVGCGLAIVSRARALQPSLGLTILAVVAIGCAVAAQTVGGIQAQATVGIPLAIAGTAVLIAVVDSGRLSWVSRIAWLGLISYSLYLWHVPILLATWSMFGRQPLPTAAALVASFAVAGVSYRLALPIRLWARDATKRPAPAEAGAGLPIASTAGPVGS